MQEKGGGGGTRVLTDGSMICLSSWRIKKRKSKERRERRKEKGHSGGGEQVLFRSLEVHLHVGCNIMLLLGVPKNQSYV